MTLQTTSRHSASVQTKKLFNLGLHLNRPNKIKSWNKHRYTRASTKWTIYNPIHSSRQMILLTKWASKLIQSGGRIAVINTGASFKKNIVAEFLSLFEGLNILCFEEEWVPGIFTNPIFKQPIPDLVIYLSAREPDQKNIFAELKSLKIPFLNFSNHDYNHNLIYSPIVANSSKLSLLVYLLLYWVQKQAIQEISFVDSFDEGTEGPQSVSEIFTTLKYRHLFDGLPNNEKQKE